MAYLLKVMGTGDRPVTDGDWAARRGAWQRERGPVTMFPRWPRIEPGDRFVDYAAGSHKAFGEGRIFAITEVASEPEPSGHERWPVQVRIRTLIAGPRLEHCPTLIDIEVDRRSLGRHSYIRLSDEQGERAENLIRRAADEYGPLRG